MSWVIRPATTHPEVTMFRRRSTARTLTAGAVGTLMLATAATPALATEITAPRGILVQRDATTPTTLNIGWKPQAGTDHVRVSVFDGTTDAVKTYPVDVLTDNHVGAGECTRYKVRIAAVAADGTSAEAAAVNVNSLAPGGLASITSARADAGNHRPGQLDAARVVGFGHRPGLRRHGDREQHGSSPGRHHDHRHVCVRSGDRSRAGSTWRR